MIGLPVRRGRVAAVLTLFLSALLVAGCSSPVAYDDSGDWVRTQQQQLLDQRAKAIRTDDEALFMQTVARGNNRFIARQRHYFEGITQLPLDRVRFTVMDTAWPQSLVSTDLPGDARAARVRQVIDIRDYDTQPEVSVTGLVIAQRGGVLKVVSDRTAGGQPFPGTAPQPWEVAPIQVVRADGVLGVFDDKTIQYASQLLSVVAHSITQDQSALPFWWSGKVVVYCFGRPALLNSFRRVPGGNIRDLGAMSFPVYANTSGSKLAGMRFVVLPTSVAAGEPYLARLVRHELTHVAVGNRDDGAPTWFIEGLAEYLGARPLPRDERRIPSVAVARAAGVVDKMPSSATFNGPDQDWHYALSWMACDYIAATFGEARLWDLMDAFHAGHGGSPDSRQDAILEGSIDMTSGQLAVRAAMRIRNMYG